MDAAELSRRLESFDGWVPPVTVKVLIRLGLFDELRRLGADGDWYCASAWASWSAEQGGTSAALAMLAPFRATGWFTAVRKYVQVLATAGRFAEAVDLVPDCGLPEVSAAVLLAELKAAQGEAGAAEAFELLRPYAVDWRVSRPWAALAERLGRDPEVVETLTAPVAETPHATPATIVLVDALERGGRADEAEAVLRSHLACEEAVHLNRIQRLLKLLLAQGREDEARALIAEPYGHWVAPAFAAHLEERGDRDAAIEMLLPFATADPAENVTECAGLLERAGRLEEAVEILRAAARAEGGQAYSALPALCRLLRAHDRLDEALEVVAGIVERRAGNTTLSLVSARADVLAWSGEVDLAVAELLAFPGRPRQQTARAAGLLADAGRAEEAIAVLRACDDQYRVAIDLAELLIREGRVAEGIAVIRNRRPEERNPEGGDAAP
ncbi:tetratricopeptide repeat protein [Catenulispora yoronensis]